MLQGLKHTGRQMAIVDDMVVRGKETNVRCPTTAKSWACPNDTIDVEAFMMRQLEDGDHDILEHILTRPKTNQYQKGIKNGPTVNQFGIPQDLMMEMAPGNLRTKGQKLKGIVAVTPGYGSAVRKEPTGPRFPTRNCFKDHIDVTTALGINTKHKKNPRRRQIRLKDKTELLLDGTDRALGRRKEVNDRRALQKLKDRIEILQSTIAEYKKGTKKSFDLNRVLKEHTELLHSTIATMSKEAKNRDLTKDLIREYQETIRDGGRTYNVRRGQRQKIRLADQRKRVITRAGISGKNKEVNNRRLDECFANDKHIRMGQMHHEADRWIQQPGTMPIPHGTMKG